MSTLIEFLLARIAEDEASDSHDRSVRESEAKRAVIDAALRAASAVDDEGCGHSESDIGSETEKCRHVPPPPGIVLPGREHPEPYDTHPIYSGCHGVPVAHDILRPLASVYSDHPDYRQEWSEWGARLWRD